MPNPHGCNAFDNVHDSDGDDDFMPPPRLSLNRQHSNLHPRSNPMSHNVRQMYNTNTYNNNNNNNHPGNGNGQHSNSQSHVNQAMAPFHHPQQQLNGGGCGNTNFSSLSMEYRPVPVNGLQDPLTAATLSIGSSRRHHHHNSGDMDWFNSSNTTLSNASMPGCCSNSTSAARNSFSDLSGYGSGAASSSSSSSLLNNVMPMSNGCNLSPASNQLLDATNYCSSSMGMKHNANPAANVYQNRASPASCSCVHVHGNQSNSNNCMQHDHGHAHGQAANVNTGCMPHQPQQCVSQQHRPWSFTHNNHHMNTNNQVAAYSSPSSYGQWSCNQPQQQEQHVQQQAPQQQQAYQAPSFAQNAYQAKSNEQAHANNEKMLSDLQQKQVEQTETAEPVENVEMALTVSRLLSLLMNNSNMDKQQILSSLPSGHVFDFLNKTMTHSVGSSVQNEIKSVLNKLHNPPGAQLQNASDNVNDSQPDDTDSGKHSQASNHSDSSDNSMSSNVSKQEKKLNSSPASSAVKAPANRRKTNKYILYNAELDSYQCTECGKLYKYICNLRSHSKIHTDNAYVCEYCDKKFGRKGNYIEHKRIHTGE
eukprot:CAMPEP_0197044250 /NCGR_PEP_ID=MMETSP1384-20130603/20350_1 /TAXON_ID=29189 /ORGANISM="Ammonia sp." /LENGTH=588 /DNA_ID=CAMNT_0042475677 /DNA_START=250 /DNA_END=2013 /DNA_ORIENTATION=+